MGSQAQPLWNSLEIARLVASCLTPLIAAYLTFVITRAIRGAEARARTNETISAWRIRVSDEAAPMLNDLLCYFTCIGNWKEQEPPAVVGMKRVLDRKMHVSAHLFSPAFIRLYMEFMDLCFETYTGWGEDARLRTLIERRNGAANWQSDWEACFSDGANCSDPEAIREKYQQLMGNFARELGLGIDSPEVPAGRVPFTLR